MLGAADALVDAIRGGSEVLRGKAVRLVADLLLEDSTAELEADLIAAGLCGAAAIALDAAVRPPGGCAPLLRPRQLQPAKAELRDHDLLHDALTIGMELAGACPAPLAAAASAAAQTVATSALPALHRPSARC